MQVKIAIRISGDDTSSHLTNILPVSRWAIERCEILIEVENVQIMGPNCQGVGYR